MPGLELGAAALVMGAAALTWRLMVGTLASRAVLMGLGLALSSCVWVLRPHVLTLFLLAVLLTLLARERWRWIPPLFLLWANAHGGRRAGWAGAGGGVGGGGAALVARPRRRRSRRARCRCRS